MTTHKTKKEELKEKSEVTIFDRMYCIFAILCFLSFSVGVLMIPILLVCLAFEMDVSTINIMLRIMGVSLLFSLFNFLAVGLVRFFEWLFIKDSD